jgi:hypothetical protein
VGIYNYTDGCAAYVNSERRRRGVFSVFPSVRALRVSRIVAEEKSVAKAAAIQEYRIAGRARFLPTFSKHGSGDLCNLT